jgi:hypothetical protein
MTYLAIRSWIAANAAAAVGDASNLARAGRVRRRVGRGTRRSGGRLLLVADRRAGLRGCARQDGDEREETSAIAARTLRAAVEMCCMSNIRAPSGGGEDCRAHRSGEAHRRAADHPVAIHGRSVTSSAGVVLRGRR